MFSNKNILISSHDAGAANLIYYWMKKNNNNNYFYYIKGPAKKIFKKKNIEISKINQLDIDLIITGTSQFSNLENEIRNIAKKLTILSITFLDHYVNYKKRFLFRRKLLLPDEIWCFDKVSYKIARQVFKNIVIKKKLNCYLSYIKKKIKLKKKQNNHLYFTEPFFYRNSGKEFLILKKFLEKFENRKNYKIKIKLHPLENINKYYKLIKNYNVSKIKVIKNSKIENLISWSDYVYGSETYAMVIASKCNKKVYTLMKPKNFRLPIPKIKYF